MKDQLDQAIDTVTSRMTQVEDDAAFASQVVDRLPERSAFFRSLMASWTLRFAVLALTLGASAIVLRTFDDRSTSVLPTVDVGSAMAPFALARSEHRTIVERSSNAHLNARLNARLNDRLNDRLNAHLNARLNARLNDPQLILPALEPVAPLADDALNIAPLEIADLPLSNDSFR